MRTIVRWLFEQTKPGQWINSHKTHLGFSMVALGIVLRALVQVLVLGLETFPGIPLLHQTHQILVVLDQGLSDGLQQAGVYVAGLGVWHDKLKRDGK